MRSNQIRRGFWLAVGVIGGAVVLFLGILSGASILLLTLVGGSYEPPIGLMAAGCIGLGLIIGIPLMIHGWIGWRGKPSRPLTGSFRLIAVAVIGLVLSLVAGAILSQIELAANLLLPPIHVVGMALPPFIILLLVGRRLPNAGTWREIVAGVANGGLLATSIAILVELILVIVLIFALVIGWMAVDGDVESLQRRLEGLQEDPDQLSDPSALAPLLSPVVVLSLLVVVAVFVPMIEEGLKSLGAGAVAGWIRPNAARAFVWGVASGVGFSLVESMLNASLIGAQPETWPIAVLSRFGTTIMHALTGGLMGWGWGQAWSAQKPLRLVLSYALALLIHGIWNGLVVSAALLAAAGEIGIVGNTGVGLMITKIAPVLLGLLVILMAVAALVGLLRMAKRLSQRESIDL